MKRCRAFEMKDPLQARQHMKLVMIRDYGWSAYGHPLHTWDDGGRYLARCETCGGLVLVQKSEFHSFSDLSDDSYYTDYFPVDSEAEAEELNRKYDGFAIEREFPERYLCMSNLLVHWSEKEQK